MLSHNFAPFFSPQIIIMVMIFHMTVRTYTMILKPHLAAWRSWRRLKLRLHSSFTGASSGPGATYRAEDLSAVSTEKSPHTPVMLKEVLQYLDVQPAQVRFLMSLIKFMSVCLKVLFKYVK